MMFRSVARKETLDMHQKNVLGYYRNLGSLRYGTSTASCKDAYGKMPFFSWTEVLFNCYCLLLVRAVVEKRTNGSAAELHEPMATIPAKSRRNGRGIWLYKRSFRHRILRFTSTEATTESCSYLTWQSRSTRSVSQGTEVTTVTEYVPCRYSTRTAFPVDIPLVLRLVKTHMGTEFNHAVLG